MANKVNNRTIRKKTDTEIYIEQTLFKIVKYVKAVQGPGINKVSEITTHLLLGTYENSLDIELLKDFNINVIIYFGTQPKEEKIINKYKRKKIQYFNIDINDVDDKNKIVPNLTPYFDYCYNLIHENVLNQKKVFLHCKSGSSLSVIMLLYYLVRRYYVINFLKHKEVTKLIVDLQNSFVLDIIKFIKENRPSIDPHPEYILQLLVIEHKIKKGYKQILMSEIKNDMYSKKLNKTKKSDSDSEDSDPDLGILSSPELYEDELDNSTVIDQYIDSLNDNSAEVYKNNIKQEDSDISESEESEPEESESNLKEIIESKNNNKNKENKNQQNAPQKTQQKTKSKPLQKTQQPLKNKPFKKVQLKNSDHEDKLEDLFLIERSDDESFNKNKVNKKHINKKQNYNSSSISDSEKSDSEKSESENEKNISKSFDSELSDSESEILEKDNILLSD